MDPVLLCQRINGTDACETPFTPAYCIKENNQNK